LWFYSLTVTTTKWAKFSKVLFSEIGEKSSTHETQQTLFGNIKEGDQREVFCVHRTKLLKWILEKHK
jgi:hypothetical protein